MSHDPRSGQIHLRAMPARLRPLAAPPRAARPRCRPHSRRHALAWAAAALLSTPAAHALDTFTANAPVYVGSWFNGTTTETHEFQFAADWAGWCNARAGADCQRIAFWNVARNWDNNLIPNGNSGDARVEAGQTVRVGSFSSLYLGPISGEAYVATLSAAGRVEISDYLRVGNASFNDLYLYPLFSRLDTTGLSTVGNLSSGLGKFGGAGGTTQLQGWSASALGKLEVLVLDDHTLKLSGVAAAPMPLDIRLVPTARLLNQGVLDLGGGQVWLQGTANVNTLPVFDNSGTLTGSGTLGAVRFNNSGSVNVGQGGSLIFAIGSHSGSFSGGVNSSLTFGGTFAGPSHRFLAGSAVNSQGDVILSSGSHQASGAWSVARTFVQGGGQIDFDGPGPQIGELHINGDGINRGALFNSAGGATLQAVYVDNTGVVEFNAGNSTAQHVTLRSGRLTNQGPLLVAQSFDWHSGALTGAGTLRLPGQTTLHAGARVMNTSVVLDGTLDWNGGNFSQWGGRMEVLPTRRVNIAGDFSSAGGGGSIFNRGAITKQAGSGRADLGMAVHSDGGLTRVLAGTLAFSGGGVHIGATFDAAPGARIELSGGTVFGPGVTVTGALDVTGGSFELITGAQYAHAAGNRFEVSDVRIGSRARLQLAGALSASGSVHNVGHLEVPGPMNVGVDFNQWGSFVLAPGAGLTVGGGFTNGAPLTLTDNDLSANRLFNPSTLTLTGAVNARINQMHNTGTLVIVPTTTGSLWVDWGLNTGTLRVDGAANSVSTGAFGNSGLIVNEGQWSSGASFSHSAGARMDNSGRLDVSGDLVLAAGSLLANAGSVVANGGIPPLPDDPLGVPSRVFIDAGASLAGAGSFTQLGGLTVVNGLLRSDAGVSIEGGTLQGAGTVQGPVTVGQNALWRLGNSPGTFSVVGDAYVAGRLEVEVQSLAVHDRLVVSGQFGAWYPTSAIDFVFDAAFQPTDGDTVQWLQAGSASVAATVNISGLPAYWSAALNPTSHVVEVTYDLANAIPLSGDHSIAAGAVGYNAIPGWNNQPNLNSLQNDGTFSNRTGGTASITTLNNASGATVLNRGELYAGTLNNAGGFQNRPGSTLTGQTLNNSGVLVNEGTVQTYGDFSNAAGAVFEQRGEMQVNGRVTNDGSLLVAGRLSGPFGYNGSGDVVIQAGGSFEGSAGGWFWTSGGNVRVDGLLAASDIRISNNNNGRLSGTGRVQGNVLAYGNIEPGNSVGTLTVDGNLQALGDVNLELASGTDFDRLVVNGSAEINHATFFLLGAFRPTLGDSFGVLSVSGALSGQQGWHIMRQVSSDDPTLGWTLWADANGIYDPAVPADWRAAFAGGTMSITAVPEPGSWALWLAGLGAMGSVVVRRRRAD